MSKRAKNKGRLLDATQKSFDFVKNLTGSGSPRRRSTTRRKSGALRSETPQASFDFTEISK
jgi:hypothetical protein